MISSANTNIENITQYVQAIMIAPQELAEQRALLLANRAMALRSSRLRDTPIPSLFLNLSNFIGDIQPDLDSFVDTLCLGMDELASLLSTTQASLDAHLAMLTYPNPSWHQAILTPWIQTFRLLNLYFLSPYFPQPAPLYHPANQIHAELVFQLSLFASRSAASLGAITTPFLTRRFPAFLASSQSLLRKASNQGLLTSQHQLRLRKEIERNQTFYWSFYLRVVGIEDLPELRAWHADTDVLTAMADTIAATDLLMSQTQVFVMTLEKKLALLEARFEILTVQDLPGGGVQTGRMRGALEGLVDFTRLISGGVREEGGWVKQKAKELERSWVARGRGPRGRKLVSAEEAIDGLLEMMRAEEKIMREDEEKQTAIKEGKKKKHNANKRGRADEL